jgi:hypothetical protein
VIHLILRDPFRYVFWLCLEAAQAKDCCLSSHIVEFISNCDARETGYHLTETYRGRVRCIVFRWALRRASIKILGAARYVIGHNQPPGTG